MGGADRRRDEAVHLKRYLLRRIAVMPLLLLGIASIVFLVSRMTPADPLVSIVGERNLNNPEVVAAAKARVGPRPVRARSSTSRT